MTYLKLGDNAPKFSGLNQNGKKISLSDYIGKKVVLYFYPKDNTPGCTKEACNLRDNYSVLQKKGFVILGVSTDNEKTHKKFADKFELPFNLIVDEDKKIVEKYGVLGEKKFMGRAYMGTNRTTFVIDENGEIEKIFDKVYTNNHTEQILAVK
ncbi:MAG: thioredoxin-dependent thiol peroxidase [Candidatus Magasanikbacteria bacterium CG_4_10_14_0_2_um_filter_37_12]|uniref:thioredoxin-dependent peroxiredoxin n=1 Tax=Candidatus Magasanikbacteria bacterium CG_4_10_14_0_2_um_filter_37_12 TaxID=1974637 RepID=A0A2M7V997_9BACT|nr:MAG: thioredoxin-dependent thiol peroxidase [Candidatus Magasanikbacteria bacterium CG_4_10_14_0_2_um_filter_37_12]